MGRVEHLIEQRRIMPDPVYRNPVQPGRKHIGIDTVAFAQVTKDTQCPQAVVIDSEVLCCTVFATHGAVQQGVQIGAGHVEPALQADHPLQAVMALGAGVLQVVFFRGVTAQLEFFLPCQKRAIDIAGVYPLVPGDLLRSLYDIGRQAWTVTALGQQFMDLLAAQPRVQHELLLLGDGLGVTIMALVKELGRRVAGQGFGEQALPGGAQVSEQTLSHIGFLLHRAVLVFRLLAVGQLQAYAVVQGTQAWLVTRQPQYTLLVSKVKRQLERVAQLGQHLLDRAVAIEIAVIAQVSLDRPDQCFIDQCQQRHLTGGVFSVQHDVLERGASLAEGYFGLSALARLLDLQCKQVKRPQIGRERVDCGQRCCRAEAVPVIFKQGRVGGG